MRYQCAHCGEWNEIDLAALVTLTPMQRTVLAQLADLQRWRRGPVKTEVLADLMDFSARYIRRFLTELEQLELVQRKGKRGGWKVAPHSKRYLYQEALPLAA